MKRLALLLFSPIILFGQVRLPIELSKIGDSVWVHTTYKLYGKTTIPSNGMIIQTSSGLVLIDTPWDDTLTTKLLDTTQNKFNQAIIFSIITHAHEDRIGGIRTLHKRGIKVVSISLTCQRAKELGYEVPEQVLSNDTIFVIGNEKIELFYPGAGHTIDNTVVWLPRQRILFGGCLVKSELSTDLGNIADADLKEWPRTIRTVMEKFRMAQVVVPGHGMWGGFNLLQHTLELLLKR